MKSSYLILIFTIIGIIFSSSCTSKEPVAESITDETPDIPEPIVPEPMEEEPSPPLEDEIPEPLIINGKTLDQRLEEAYDDLHKPGSSQKIRDNFPDIKVVYTDEGDGYGPDEIYPFRYHYSEEADITFNLCNVERTVFICEGKLSRQITDEDMDSGRCQVTPIYRGIL